MRLFWSVFKEALAPGKPTWLLSMFWLRVGSSNSVELLLLDGRLLPDNKKKTNQLQKLLTFSPSKVYSRPNHSVQSTYKSCTDLIINTRKGKAPGGRSLTWSPPLNDHSLDQGSGCSDEWVFVAERVNQVSRLVHLIEREGIKSAEIIGSNSVVTGQRLALIEFWLILLVQEGSRCLEEKAKTKE